MKKQIKKYIIFVDWKSVEEENPFILDCSDLDITEEELELNIHEQIYKEYLYLKWQQKN